MVSTSPPRSANAHARLFWGIAVWAICTAALAWHVRQYPALTYDDAFISLRYAQRFLEGHGLTWTEGPPVEGYSNLSWVLSSALLGALGMDLVDAPIALGVASAVATLAAVVYGFPATRWRHSLPALAGGLFLALAGPIAVWAKAGLEGCLVAALVAWSLVLLRPIVDDSRADPREAWKPGVPMALLCLTRPDGPLFVVLVCGFLALRTPSRIGLVRACAVGALPAVATLGQLAFRLAYYGDWLPNTARAKVALTATRAHEGLECVGSAAQYSAALLVPVALGIYVAWRDRHRRPRLALAFFVAVGWTAYSATIACDPFGFRMLIPTVVLFVFIAADAFAWAIEQGRRVALVAWLGAAGLLVAFGVTQQTDPNLRLAQTQRPPATRRAATIGVTLRDAFSSADPLIAVDAAGAIPFHSGLRSLDMLGLNDAHIARQRGERFGEGLQGHELGDAEYVLRMAPDVIVAGVLGLNRLAYPGGRELATDPRFRSRYRRLALVGDQPVPLRFFAFFAIDGRLGIERAEHEVVIPGYLFGDGRGAQVELDEDLLPVARLFPPAEATLERIDVPAGTWSFSAEAEGLVDVIARGPNGRLKDPVELDAPAQVSLTVSSATPTLLRRIVGRRLR